MRDINLGATIARERRAAGITQGELAAHLGVTKAAVSKWELGQSLPDVALLPRIAAFFALTLDELFGYRPQLSGEEVGQRCLEVLTRFSQDPDAAYEGAERLIAEYYSCWRLLHQIGMVYVQRGAFDPDRTEALAARALELFERVEAHADDVELVCGARMMRAALLNMQGDVDGAIELMESLKPDVPMGVEMLLAGMYQLKGDRERSLRLYQESMGFGMVNAMTCVSSQLPLYVDDRAHLDALLQAGEGLVRGFCLEEENPVAVLTFASSAATSCLQAGDDVRATAYLERFVSLIEGIDGKQVALGVRKSVLYDRAPQMAGVSPDQVGMANAQLGEIDVRQQCAQAILACPEWAERADDGRFGPLLDRLGAIR